MELRDFGKRSGLSVRPVSIGAMRLPGDVKDAVDLVRRAIDAGMCYIDTSRGYGESEFVLGRALQDGYRDKVILSTKCSPWIKKVRDTDEPDAATTRQRIEESILRLGVDYLDFYQIWNVNNRENWDKATRPGGMLDGIRGAMEDGLVRHTGFTTHDSVENLLDYIETAEWAEVILFSYNMLSQTYAPAIEAAHNKGIGTIVMNPVGGGKLAEHSPVLDDLVKQVDAESLADLAVRWVLSNPNVTTIISGISKPSDVDDTVASGERGPLDAEQMKTVTTFFNELSREKVGFCTGCKYCMPCPTGINIPAIMSCVYEDRFLGLKSGAKGAYRWAGKVKADACIKCGKCEEKCTQHLNIIEEMACAAAEYGDN